MILVGIPFQSRIDELDVSSHVLHKELSVVGSQAIHAMLVELLNEFHSTE